MTLWNQVQQIDNPKPLQSSCVTNAEDDFVAPVHTDPVQPIHAITLRSGRTLNPVLKREILAKEKNQLEEIDEDDFSDAEPVSIDTHE